MFGALDYTEWQMANGEFIKISEMSEQHIRNCLDWIELRSPETEHIALKDNNIKKYNALSYGLIKPYIEAFESELRYRETMKTINEFEIKELSDN